MTYKKNTRKTEAYPHKWITLKMLSFLQQLTSAMEGKKYLYYLLSVIQYYLVLFKNNIVKGLGHFVIL